MLVLFLFCPEPVISTPKEGNVMCVCVKHRPKHLKQTAAGPDVASHTYTHTDTHTHTHTHTSNTTRTTTVVHPPTHNTTPHHQHTHPPIDTHTHSSREPEWRK